MEDNKYPHIDEEEGVGMCCEPIADVATPSVSPVDGITHVHDWIDDLDWDRLPSQGPFSDEEAILRIEEAEADLKDPSKWISSEEMDRRLYERFPWLR